MFPTDQTDRIRQDQIKDVRRTLSVPEGAQRRPMAAVRPEPQKQRFVAKGHDAILKALQDNKSQVTIITACGGETYTGTIFGRDKFTITLQQGGLRRVFYKHDISQFFAVVPEQETEKVAA